MVKVVNEGPMDYRVPQKIPEDIPGTTKYRLVKKFSQDYRWAPAGEKGSTIDVKKDEFDLMVDREDFTMGKIYTKEQWKERLELVKKQKELTIAFNKASGEEQERLRKQLLLSDRESYLIRNNLPHEA